ncbi:uncharacterized protein PFL1_02214 [Pseudozyma flocculosa PF-1]|uniref:Uncharacterized protein n=1 Tax=Pseudozyma flocculosa TaxID=84751 RepID=A0A5C3FCP8_9BASI|nr:uncharacterized protein PFL1_02214 [Pseudozyma flocculosa PF-1]EPQ30097.1 hypothetical protein PFL1_02214 [Pseudozyma flocculosa PF-1]SPO41445.1 uncharacterized protein PSFLO_06927 [Pseudozyma flocculosa]
MAHQAHNLPWSILVDCLSLVDTGPRGTPQRITVVELCRHQDDGAVRKRIRHFARVFVRTLADFAESERTKTKSGTRRNPVEPDAYTEDGAAGPLIPIEVHRSLVADPGSYFGREGSENTLQRLNEAREWGGPVYYADSRAAVVMALLAHGEMRVLFRIARLRTLDLDEKSYQITLTGAASNPSDPIGCSPLAGLWSIRGYIETGFINVWTAALEAYLYYNATYCLPQLWAAGDAEGRTSQRDYRASASFFRVVEDTTGPRDGDASAYPHREFYGTAWHVPDGCNVDEHRKRLDPLDTSNSECLQRLKEYLSMCWDHLVRVYAVITESGASTEWEEYIIEAIERIWH